MMYVSVAWSSWLVRPSTSSVGARSSGARAAGTSTYAPAAHVDEKRPALLLAEGQLDLDLTCRVVPHLRPRGECRCIVSAAAADRHEGGLFLNKLSKRSRVHLDGARAAAPAQLWRGGGEPQPAELQLQLPEGWPPLALGLRDRPLAGHPGTACGYWAGRAAAMRQSGGGGGGGARSQSQKRNA
eukprot:COSAG06_NODE_17142_length_959_cov_0.954651_1_plen_183_part_10